MPLELDTCRQKHYIGKDSFMAFFKSHLVLTRLPMHSVDREDVLKAYHDYCTGLGLQEAKSLNISRHLRKSGVPAVRYYSGAFKTEYVGVSWKEGHGQNVNQFRKGKFRTMTLEKYRELVKNMRKERKPKHIIKKEKEEAKIVGMLDDVSGGFYASVTVQPVKSHFEWLFPKVVIPSWDEEKEGRKEMETTKNGENDGTKKTTKMWHVMESAKLRTVTKEERGHDEVQMFNMVEEVDEGNEIHVLALKMKEVKHDLERMFEGEKKDREKTIVMKNSEENNVSLDGTEIFDEELHKVLITDMLRTEDECQMKKRRTKSSWNVNPVNSKDDMVLVRGNRNAQKTAQPHPSLPRPAEDKNQKENINTMKIMEEMKANLETKEMDMIRNTPTIPRKDKEGRGNTKNIVRTKKRVKSINAMNILSSPTATCPFSKSTSNLTITSTSSSGTSPAAPRVSDTVKHNFEPYEKTFELIEAIRNLEDKYGYPAVYKLADNIAEKGDAPISMKTKTRTEQEVQLEKIKFTIAYLNLWKALQFYLLPLLPMGEAKPIREAKKAIKEYMRHMEEDKYRFALVLWEMLKHVREERREEVLGSFFLKLVRSKYVMECRMNYFGQEEEEDRKDEEMEMSYSDSEKVVIDEEDMDNDDYYYDNEGEKGDDEDKEAKEEENEKDNKDVEKYMNEPLRDDQVNETESVREVNDDENYTNDSEAVPNRNTMPVLTATNTTVNTQPTTADTVFPITTTATRDTADMVQLFPAIAVTTVLETMTTTTTTTPTMTPTRPKIRNTAITNTLKSHTSNSIFTSDPTLEFIDDDDTEFMSSRCSSNCISSPSSSSDYNEEELQQHLHDDIHTSVQSKHAAREREKMDALTDEFRLVMNATEYYKSYTGRLLNHELWREVPCLVEMLLGEEVMTPCVREFLDNISLQEWAEFCEHPDFMDSLSSFFR